MFQEMNSIKDSILPLPDKLVARSHGFALDIGRNLLFPNYRRDFSVCWITSLSRASKYGLKFMVVLVPWSDQIVGPLVSFTIENGTPEAILITGDLYGPSDEGHTCLGRSWWSVGPLWSAPSMISH